MKGHLGAQENVLHCAGRATQVEHKVLVELLTSEKIVEGGDWLILAPAKSAGI